ncbi:MAG: hypothetical protein ACRC2T_01755, partial [Thermoguttaceae bacterium]
MILTLTFVQNIVLAQVGSGNAAPSWRDQMESQNACWQLLNSSIENRRMVLKRERVSGDSHSGDISEKWKLIVPQKTDFYLGLPIDFPWLLPETSPSVWVKSNKPGLAIGAQIVLPHTYNKETGRPFTFIVSGSKYNLVGEWQELNFLNASKLPILHKDAEQAAKSLRIIYETRLDIKDMYIR